MIGILVRFVCLIAGVLCLTIEARDLWFSVRAQGWISVLGFALIIAAGWFLLPRHSLAVVFFALFSIPIGAIWLVPIVSQLGIIILIVLGFRWVVLKVRSFRHVAPAPGE